MAFDAELLRESFYAQMSAQMPDDAQDVCHFDVFDELPSTNRHLMDLCGSQPDAASQTRLCATAMQTAGVGRRGAQWVSGPDCITFSILNTLPLAPAQISGLSLVTGLAVAGALQPLCGEIVRLKWPNDILVGPHKLCGILTELPKLGQQSVTSVTGIGINYCHDSQHQQLQRPYTTLLDLVATLGVAAKTKPAALPARELLIGRIAALTILAHRQFAQDGWPRFAAAFEARDYLAGKVVKIEQGDRQISGTACGVDASGALLLLVDGVRQSFNAGEVSIGHQGFKEN